MMKMKNNFCLLKSTKKLNESGQIALDFLYGATLILVVTVLLSALTIVLTLAEVYQYITFSAARSYFAADADPGIQASAAEAKAQSLLTSLPFLQGAQANNWISIVGNMPDPSNPSRAKDYSRYAQSLGVPSQADKNQFIGYQIQFKAPLLQLNLPLIGEAVQPPGKEGFVAKVSAFLMREPTQQECEAYNKSLYQFIILKDPQFNQAVSGPASGLAPANYVAINDNGC